jgi:AcrR family transcriptional regulator
MAAVPDPPWWRRREDSSRAERKPLTRDAIVDAALRLLERDGLHGLSMRRLAHELGSGAASLYWHVGDKEQLLALMLDRIVGEAQLIEPDAENWQETVKEMLRGMRRLLTKRRDAAALSLGRIPAGPNSLPVMERTLAILKAAGLPARVISYASDMFALYVGGFAFEEGLGHEGDPAQLGAYWASLPADRFPTLAGMASELVHGDADERFEFAIELLVRGLEAMAAAPGGPGKEGPPRRR